ncbi:hypothetical protein EIP86_011460, partial [Pleurotus ostreatoroseus]
KAATEARNTSSNAGKGKGKERENMSEAPADATAPPQLSEDQSTPTERPRPHHKVFNLSTYKLHALGDYPDTIPAFGTTDNYSTQTGELEHRHVKRFYSRTNRNAYDKTKELLDPSIAHPARAKDEDWRYFYVNIFVDRDMFMRFRDGELPQIEPDIASGSGAVTEEPEVTEDAEVNESNEMEEGEDDFGYMDSNGVEPVVDEDEETEERLSEDEMGAEDGEEEASHDNVLLDTEGYADF